MVNAIKKICSAAAVAALVSVSMAGAATPAFAGATFDVNLTFVDGHTAVGTFTVADYNLGLVPQFLQSWDITTSDALPFEGNHYFLGSGEPTAQFFNNNELLVFNRPGYDGFLVLDFNKPLDGSGVGPFDLAALYNLAGSYECDNGFQQFNPDGSAIPASCSGVDAIISPLTATPEPQTLSLFGAGLAGAAALRRRKKRLA